MLENAVRICDAKFGVLFLTEGDAFRYVALHGAPPAFAEARRREPVTRVKPGTTIGRVAATKKPAQTADIRAEPAYTSDPERIPILELAGARTILGVPMLKESELVGAIVIYRQEVRPFTDKQIELVQNFAAQAVIAIENTRLLNELRQRTDDLTESLEQQTATSEVLKVISSSPGELEPVFEAMLENAVRICEAKFGNLLLVEGDAYRHVALYGAPQLSWRNGGATPSFARDRDLTLIVSGRPSRSFTLPTCRWGEPPPPQSSSSAGARTFLDVPMLKDDELVGDHRHLPPGGPALHRQADRAGQELRRPGRHRHREHAAAQRAAPAHRRSDRGAGAADRDRRRCCKVISPARRASWSRCSRPCWRMRRDSARPSSALCFCARATTFVQSHSTTCRRALAELRRREPIRPRRTGTSLHRRAKTKQVVHIADLTAEPAYFERDQDRVASSNWAGIAAVLVGADAQGRRADRRDRHLPPGSAPVHRQADRAGEELRRPGRHRHREHAAAQRAARIAAAADRHRRRAQGHQPLDLRSADGAANAR